MLRYKGYSIMLIIIPMADTLIDIYNNILQYNGETIIVIIDDTNMPWFSAPSIAKIIGYERPNNAIRMHVDETDKKTFQELEKFMKKIHPNVQPHTIYINEPGLYSLILASKMPIAKTFKKWVTTVVIPSIRNTGTYTISEKYKRMYDDLNNKFKNVKDENRILKHNQKKHTHKKGALVYILRPIDAKNKKLLKLGHTTNFDKRFKVYNVSVPDDMEVLFEMEVNDSFTVEKCTKLFMQPHQYRDKKEYYECSLKKLRETIINCNTVANCQGTIHCVRCNNQLGSFNEYVEHLSRVHNIDEDETLFMDLHGGADNNGSVYVIRHPNDLENLDEIDYYFNQNNVKRVDVEMEIFFAIGLDNIKRFNEHAIKLQPYMNKYLRCSLIQFIFLLAKDPDNITYVRCNFDFDTLDDFICGVKKIFNISDTHEIILDICPNDRIGSLVTEHFVRQSVDENDIFSKFVSFIKRIFSVA